jgi:hypothetical protein
MTDEPIAWLYTNAVLGVGFRQHTWPKRPDGWTETPLYGPEALAARDARIEQLEAALTKSEALQDLAYYNGAKQYAAISAQSEDAARDWLNGGCGNRQRDAIAALGDAK